MRLKQKQYKAMAVMSGKEEKAIAVNLTVRPEVLSKITIAHSLNRWTEYEGAICGLRRTNKYSQRFA